MKIQKGLALLGAAIVAITIGLGARQFLPGAEEREPLSSAAMPTIGGPFTLTDHTGRTVTEQEFKGRHLLVYFGYTYCPDVCPTSLQAIGDALALLPPEQAAKVTPVLVTIDPERDTPEVLKEYVAHFHPSTVGLTGSREQIDAASRAYRVYAKRAAEEIDGVYHMDHTSITYLMGPDGKFITHFSHGATPEQIAETLKKHL